MQQIGARLDKEVLEGGGGGGGEGGEGRERGEEPDPFVETALHCMPQPKNSQPPPHMYDAATLILIVVCNHKYRSYVND